MSTFDRDSSHLFQRTLVAPSIQLLPGGAGRDFPTPANQALGVTLSVDSSGNLTISGAVVLAGNVDLNGVYDLIFDADADTYLSSDSVDDVVDFYINGAKDFTFSANQLMAYDASNIVLGTGSDDTIGHDGTLTTWTHATGDLVFDNTDTNDQIILRVGTDTTATGIEFRNNSDVAMWAVEPISASAGRLRGVDNSTLILGTGSDLTLRHDGTNSYVESITGNLILDNQAATGATYCDLGTDTSATSAGVRNNSGTVLFSVDGSGVIRAGAGMWAGAPSPANPDPSIAHVFFDDFLALSTDWTVTEDDAADTQAVADAQHGMLVLTQKATTDNDAAQVTWAQETFKITSGKKMWFEARIRCPAGDATNLDFFVGLAEAEDLTGVADNMPANGIGFHKEDGDANIDLSSSDNGSDTQQATVGTLLNNTWIRLGFVFNGGASGVGTITPYVDGVAGTSIVCTYGTMAEMAPIFMLRNGDGTTTQVLNVDYVKVVTER